MGLPQKAPFSRILVSAAAREKIPEKLIAQLADNGIIVCPVGNSIIKVVNYPGGVRSEEYPGFAFVRIYDNGINP